MQIYIMYIYIFDWLIIHVFMNFNTDSFGLSQNCYMDFHNQTELRLMLNNYVWINKIQKIFQCLCDLKKNNEHTFARSSVFLPENSIVNIGL